MADTEGKVSKDPGSKKLAYALRESSVHPKCAVQRVCMHVNAVVLCTRRFTLTRTIHCHPCPMS